MKSLVSTFTLLLVFIAVPALAQLNQFHLSVSHLEEGLDEQFYSNSHFGVKNPIYSAFPVTDMIRFNRVDGLFLGVKEERMSWTDNELFGLDNVNIHGMIGYSFGLKEAQYMLGLDKKVGSRLLIGGEYHHTTSTEDYWRSGSYENSVSSFFAGFDFHDYHKMDGFGIYSMLRPFNKLELGAAYSQDTYSSLSASTDYALFSKSATFRPNPAIDGMFDVIDQQSLTLGITYNPEIKLNSFITTTASLKAELSDVNDFENDFLYNKYIAEVKSFLKLDKSTMLKWRLMAGSITGDAPDFKNFALGGIGTMRAFDYKFMRGNEMVLSNIELDFGRETDNNHGWVDLSYVHLSLFLDSGYSSWNERLFTSSDPGDALSSFKIADMKHNAGIGFGIGIFKFEVAKPIAGAEGHTAFWLRLNPAF